MAVLVQNEGYGTAFNFQITSAQPQIIDNEKGLLINFNIIGAAVNNQPVSPSLTVNFGNVQPQTTQVGTWYFTSSLDGLFTGYSATFQDIDPLGSINFSPIKGVQIYEITHMVEADGAWYDGLPDFLVINTNDINNLPNELYRNDGTVQPVSVVQSATTSGSVTPGNLQVQISADFPAGFCYVLVPDPAVGQFPLQNVLYTNGTSFLTNNFWITDQTFIGQGLPPLLQTNLHLFVYHTNAGPDTFTLVYTNPAPPIVTNPPVSSVFSLPAQSPPTFGVVWNGESYVGGAPIAYYDIYASDDGGPFNVWQSETTANSALFNGRNGHTYAFYSIATDTAGHREAPPLQPQAETTVESYTNPPSISIVPTVTLDAGQTLSLSVTASDSNPESVLTFSLGPGAPVGVVVNPNTGQITWQTSPQFGGTTNIISVIVSDNSQPPLTATGTVSVVLLSVANPPILAPISNYKIYVGQTLTITNYAVDENTPPRPLTFSLAAGAPTNATINATNGLFQWQPTESQGRSTNVISVTVTDNGSPPLSATQQFTVIVRPVAYQWALNLGTTGVLVGTTGSVPVTLQSSLPLTNLTAVVQVPTALLTNFVLLPTAPEILSTAIQPLGSNEYIMNLSLNPSLSPGGSRTVGQLGFLALPQTNSTIVPLPLSQLSGLQENGQVAPQSAAFGGEVFIIGSQPILDAWLSTNAQRKLTLYGIPGASYNVEYLTNFLGANWQSAWLVPMTNLSEVFSANQSLPQVFYRAVQFLANPPILQMNSFSRSNVVLLLYGQNGSNYMIISGTNLLNITNWNSIAGFTLTNSFQFINAGIPTNQMQFFKAERQ